MLRIKRICSTIENFKHYCTELKQKFIQKGYEPELLEKNISKVKTLNRNDMLQRKNQENSGKARIPLTLTYNGFLPNISKVFRKHWNLLLINDSLKETFNCQPITAFKRNVNLRELIGSNKIEQGKVKKRQAKKLKPGKCFPCLTNTRTLCCRQIKKATTFKSQQTKRTYRIFHNVNCTSSYVIYLMECTLCNKQYVGKAETSFNLRLNNHRKDVKKPDSIMACKHFQKNGHNFNKHAKFIIIDQLTNTTKSKEILTQRLIERENFWIQKLETLYPKGLNMELSK